jgi:MFS family permease
MAESRTKSTNPWLVLLVLCTGFFMIMLDTTIVNVAIPAMSAGLNTTLDQILWVLNAYILVYAVLLITAGRLGDLYGQRNLFAIGLAIFTVASALCGFAQDANQLIAARVLQGVGGALLTPQTLAILTTLFPPERRGAAFGIWAGVAGLATLAGPTSAAPSSPTSTGAGSFTSTSRSESPPWWRLSPSSRTCGLGAGTAGTSWV